MTIKIFQTKKIHFLRLLCQSNKIHRENAWKIYIFSIQISPKGRKRHRKKIRKIEWTFFSISTSLIFSEAFKNKTKNSLQFLWWIDLNNFHNHDLWIKMLITFHFYSLTKRSIKTYMNMNVRWRLFTFHSI